MKCAKAQNLIALDVEGDLAEKQAPALRDHLAACPACAEFAQEMRESQWALKSWGESGPENAVLLRARQTALEQIRFEQDNPASPWSAWIARPRRVHATAGLAVLACLAAGWLALRGPRSSAVVAESPAAQTQSAEAREKELPGRAAPAHDSYTTTPETPSVPEAAETNEPAKRAEPAMASFSREPVEHLDEAPLAPRIEVVSINTDAASAEGGSETVLLNIASSDPNVLLYWVMDDQGGS